MGLGAGFWAGCWVWGWCSVFPRSPSGAPRVLRDSPAPSVEPPGLLSPVLRPTFPFHSVPPPLSFGSAPFPSGARSSGAPRFLRERPDFLRERPGFYRERVLRERPVGRAPSPYVPSAAPHFVQYITSALLRSPFFVPSVTNLMFTYLLSAQIGSEQRFKDNPERQTRKTQDEPQWIVAQRRLSARTIPGFS